MRNLPAGIQTMAAPSIGLISPPRAKFLIAVAAPEKLSYNPFSDCDIIAGGIGDQLRQEAALLSCRPPSQRGSQDDDFPPLVFARLADEVRFVVIIQSGAGCEEF